MRRICKDCYPSGPDPWTKPANYRPAPYPGPRCATHHKERQKQLKEAAHGRWILKTYGLTKEQYERLHEGQGGLCYICRRATGSSRRLSVDHDHATGFVRGLLCRPCNTILGRFRDDPESFDRAGHYLRLPPAYDLIGRVKSGEQGEA